MNEPTQPFSNPVLNADHLPDYSEAELQPVAPKFRRYLLFSTLTFWAIPLLLSAVSGWLPFINITFGWLTFAGLAVLTLLILLYRFADARHRGWALREHDLIAQSGVWWRSTTTLPIARIQHVETSSGPVERTLDLARLSCYTAGGMTADLVVIALQTETANQLREHLIEQIRLRDEAASVGQVIDQEAVISEVEHDSEPAADRVEPADDELAHLPTESPDAVTDTPAETRIEPRTHD